MKRGALKLAIVSADRPWPWPPSVWVGTLIETLWLEPQALPEVLPANVVVLEHWRAQRPMQAGR
jgi:hypothetical protein